MVSVTFAHFFTYESYLVDVRLLTEEFLGVSPVGVVLLIVFYMVRVMNLDIRPRDMAECRYWEH